MSALFGMAIALVGLDVISGAVRFDFRNTHLLGGFHLVPLLIGTFVLPEILLQVETIRFSGDRGLWAHGIPNAKARLLAACFHYLICVGTWCRRNPVAIAFDVGRVLLHIHRTACFTNISSSWAWRSSNQNRRPFPATSSIG